MPESGRRDPRTSAYSERAASFHIAEGFVSHESYLMVDDFIGQGGTLANFRGHIEAAGGVVLAAVVGFDRQTLFSGTGAFDRNACRTEG